MKMSRMGRRKDEVEHGLFILFGRGGKSRRGMRWVVAVWVARRGRSDRSIADLRVDARAIGKSISDGRSKMADGRLELLECLVRDRGVLIATKAGRQWRMVLRSLMKGVCQPTRFEAMRGQRGCCYGVRRYGLGSRGRGARSVGAGEGMGMMVMVLML